MKNQYEKSGYRPPPFLWMRIRARDTQVNQRVHVERPLVVNSYRFVCPPNFFSEPITADRVFPGQ